jgi:hypothetical protein
MTKLVNWKSTRIQESHITYVEFKLISNFLGGCSCEIKGKFSTTALINRFYSTHNTSLKTLGNKLTSVPCTVFCVFVLLLNMVDLSSLSHFSVCPLNFQGHIIPHHWRIEARGTHHGCVCTICVSILQDISPCKSFECFCKRTSLRVQIPKLIPSQVFFCTHITCYSPDSWKCRNANV